MINPVLPKTQETSSKSDRLTSDLKNAREAINTESDALKKLAENLGESLTDAVDLFISATGRIIVTGMGKNSHIGKKMAATFASTGSPSFFVHPSEAGHGDLGMISKEDVVLMLSNSGESAELKTIIAYCKRFSIPLVSITSVRDSTLGQQSDVILELPKADEVCPTGKAPTTSTTMTLALGDALAVVLMNRYGFTAEDFSVFHPGGKLGKKLIKVKDVMRHDQELPLVGLKAIMQDALDAMSENNFGRAIVVNNDGELTGFISDGDLRRHMAPDLMDVPVVDIMSKNPKSIDEEDTAAKALAIMNEREITDLVVTREKKPIGLLRLHDILKAGIA